MLIDTHCHLDFPDFDGRLQKFTDAGPCDGVEFAGFDRAPKKEVGHQECEDAGPARRDKKNCRKLFQSESFLRAGPPEFCPPHETYRKGFLRRGHFRCSAEVFS